MKQAVALSVTLVLLSNSMTWFLYTTGIDRDWIYVPWALVLLAAAVWWARRSGGLTWTEMGLSGEQWRRSALVGAASGLGVAVLVLALLAFPFWLARPVQYREIQDLGPAGLLWRLAVELTVATALTEEVLFRGILQALFKRSLSATSALLGTSLVFALWHLGVNALSLQQNSIALPSIPTAATLGIGYLGSLVAVGLGGFVLSLMRERTHHLAGSIALHWVVVAAMTLLIYRS